VLIKGNLIKADQKQNAKFNDYTLFLDINSPLKDYRKRPFHFRFRSVLLGHQLEMFDLPSHKVTHGKYSTHVSNPSNNNMTQEKFD
jgi:hypothetical protein